MDFEYLTGPTAAAETGMQDLNLLIAAITVVASFYTTVVMVWWFFRLKYFKTNLRPLILAIALAKSALCFWSATGVFQILFYDMNLPLISLPARLLFMVAAVLQSIVTMHYYGVENVEDPPGPFQKLRG
jgi:hypothetical protein